MICQLCTDVLGDEPRLWIANIYCTGYVHETCWEALREGNLYSVLHHPHPRRAAMALANPLTRT